MELMAAWWYGWAFTCCVMMGLGWISDKIPQRLGELKIFGLLFRSGHRSAASSLLLAAFIWPLLATAILVLLIDNDDDTGPYA